MNRMYYSEKRQNVSPDYMAEEREEYTMPSYEPPKKYNNVCRYTLLRTLRDSDTQKLYHENWNKKYVTYDKSVDTYIKVPRQYENRIDLLAYKYYGNARFWWIIALANEIIDPFDLPVNTQLRIPPKDAIYNTGGVLSAT